MSDSKLEELNDLSIYKNKINLGLCCINTQLRASKPTIFCSRTLIRKNFTVEKAKILALKNVKDICKLIQWNENNSIKCLRLSSDIFPHFTDLETESYTIDFAREELKKAGDLARKYGHRIVMHPSQYNQVGANTKKVLESTIADLSHHADILDAMEMDDNAVMIVHGGGVYKTKVKKLRSDSIKEYEKKVKIQESKDKNKTINRWIEQFTNMPEKVKKRLVIENCERSYNLYECLKIAEACKIPVVFDNHHWMCNNKLYPDSEITETELVNEVFPRVIKTWENRKMLCHISEQGKGRLGHHSDYIESIPNYFFELVKKYGISFDLEVEAKMKELAIKKLYKLYPFLS